MANYNPHAPFILGNEFTGIRDEELLYEPLSNSFERGYGFHLDTARNVGYVRAYINEFPDGFIQDNTFTANIYPRGAENQSGPVRRVIIPCNNGIVTGDALTSGSFSFVGGASNVQTAMWNPSSESAIQVRVGELYNATVICFFGVNNYAQLLYNKRILGVNFLCGIDIGNLIINGGNDQGFLKLWLANDYSIINTGGGFSFANGGALEYGPLVSPNTPTTDVRLDRIRLGDVSRFYGVTGQNSAIGTVNVRPWNFGELARFEASHPSRLHMRFTNNVVGVQSGSTSVLIGYAALEVFYCEETRVGVGSRIFQVTDFSTTPMSPYFMGANQIQIRNMATGAGLVLPAGDYSVTLNQSNFGDTVGALRTAQRSPTFNELRVLEELNTVTGVQVNLPFPLNDEAINTTLTEESTVLIPQLSLHASGGSPPTLTETHGYGRVAPAEVYGSVVARQELYDDILGAATSYNTVRFFARRFGETAVPLTFSGYSPAAGLLLPGTAGAYASTPDAAALDIVGDIDLRIDLTAADWTPGTTSALIAKWGVAGQRSYLFNLNTAGALELAWSTNGTAVSIATSTAAIPIAEGRLTLRATLDVDNGAVGNDATFYIGPTIDGPWTQLGAVVTQAGVTSIFAGTLAVEVGSQSIGTLSLLSGVVHVAQIHPGINAVPVATPNFSAQPAGTTSFNDSVGRTWTINGAASIIAGISASSVTITPDEFDALTTDIVDGWKRVDLRFTTPPSMGAAGLPESVWQWSAPGETAGNRWEVLANCAPAVTGTPVNTVYLSFVPTVEQLYESTYQPPSGSIAELTWVPQGMGSPYVTGSVQDDSSDAVLIFAQDMAPVTGFGVTVRSQAITGIGQNCGIDPCGIPTHILYNQLQWGLPVNTGLASDSFTRNVSNGLGSADRGGAYTLSGVATQYAVNGSQASITPSAVSVMTLGTLANIGVNVDMTIVVSASGALTAGTTARASAVARHTDVNNYYSALVQTTADTNATILGFQKTVAGVETVLGTVAIPNTMNNSTQLKVRFLVQGTLLKAKAWSVYNPEPTYWQIETTDTSLTTGTGVGFAARSGTLASNTLLFDNLSVGPTNYWFGYYELQRNDDITEWQTIMKATNPAVTGFRDYEARVGMSSSYRIRSVDLYDFAGPWSSTVSVSTISPGVSGSCLSDAHVMIFTTNAVQSGIRNLAYSNAWESEVEEPFGFPEATALQLQPMYDRNFFTAFHPLERGGEQFTRTLLVQAAAISPETLADFTSLRDMAWASVPYVCVRDEDGNRWFAAITVPSGMVRNRRRLYTADIGIVEVTATAAEVDPS
jgi:hypothetical protein